MMNFKKMSYVLYLFLCLPVVASAFDSFDCIGTDPNWQLSIAQHQFTFKQHAKINFNMVAVAPKPAENMNIDHIRVFRTKENNNDVTIIIQKQSCSDGISEEMFAYEGLFITKDKVFHGCCSKKILLTQ